MCLRVVEQGGGGVGSGGAVELCFGGSADAGADACLPEVSGEFAACILKCVEFCEELSVDVGVAVA